MRLRLEQVRKRILLVEATDDAFQRKYPMRECVTLYHCIGLFVGGSKFKDARNVPEYPSYPKSNNNFYHLMEEDVRYIHVSCHGDARSLYLRGKDTFDYDEFLDVHFSSNVKLLFLNACEVAKGPATLAALATMCKGERKEKYVIAPSKQVSFETALLFSIHFYRLLLVRRMSIVKAFIAAASLLKDFPDLDYVCLDANKMKEHLISGAESVERNLRC